MTTPDVALIAPVIKVGGSLLSTLLVNDLIDMRIITGLRLPSRCRLTFLDSGFAVSTGSAFELDTTLSVAAGDGSPLFTGNITGIELDVDRGASNLTVIADDAAFKMTLGNRVRTFTQMTYSTIINQVFTDRGMTANVTATSVVQDYVLQADSDFGFLSEICDRIGYDWWMDPSGIPQFHPMGSDDGSTVPTLRWRDSLWQFSVRASGLHPGQVTVNGWDASSAQSVSSVSGTVTGTPDADLVKPYIAAAPFSSSNAVATGFRMFGAAGDGQGLAASAAALAAAGAVTAEGTCSVNPSVQVGHTVSVQDVGPASGRYPVTEVEHIYASQGFLTRFVAGDRRPTSLVDTLSGGAPSSFRSDALVIGIVTNAGGGSGPAGHVKVRYPSLGAQIDSAWARVVALGAGASRGMTFLPEVNDEVIVGFEGGDVTRPLVLGGLYSSKNTALDYGVAEGEIARRQIVSRLGHVVELGDGTEPADQHIRLTLAGGEHQVDLSKTGLTAKIPAGDPVSISAGDTKIEFDKSGNITISGQKVTIKAVQAVEISGLNVTIKADVKAEMSAAQAKITGSGTAEMSSGGMSSVKGATVMIN